MEKKVIPRKEYMKKQIEEALSEENKWYAGEKLGHAPTVAEAIIYYAECPDGGAKHFAEEYIPEDMVKKPDEAQNKSTKNEKNDPPK